MADKIRIGIIGAGGIFRTRHFPGLAQIDDAEVVAICNRSEASGGQNCGRIWIASRPDDRSLRAHCTR